MKHRPRAVFEPIGVGRQFARVAFACVVFAALAGAATGFGSVVQAQTAGSRIDQPTPGTLPSGTSTVEGGSGVRVSDRGTGTVAPPSKIQSSTDVMAPERGIQGKGGSARTNPIEHLPKTMR